MTQPAPESQLKRCLEVGEKLEWAGRPDSVAFNNGLVRPYMITTNNAFLDNRLFRRVLRTFLVIIVFLAIFFALGSGDEALVVATPFGMNPVFLLIFFLPVVFYMLRYFNIYRRNNWTGRGQVLAESLTYGITNNRLLILSNGVIEEEFLVSEVHPKLVERLNAPGFGDIIWGKRVLHSHHESRPSALEIEKSRIGFKALPDADLVMQKIESWRKRQVEEMAQEGEAFLNQSELSAGSGTIKAGRDEKATSASEKQGISRAIKNTTMGFSIEFPEQWDLKVRKRRLAFGKWGLEKEAVWSEQDDLSKWNVVKVESKLGSMVEVQVHKTKPINTFEKLVASNNRVAGILELVDKNPDFSVNGLKGFYVTRFSGGDGSIPILGQIVKISELENIPETYTRLHVFHDGQKQYYVESVWRRDAPAEGLLCEAIVASLKPG